MDEDKKKSRKADVFAGDGSFAGKLRKRRQAIEADHPEDQPAMNPVMEQPEVMPARYRPEGSGRFTDNEIKTGYRCIKGRGNKG